MPNFPVTTLDQLASALHSRRAMCGLTQAQTGAKVGLLPKTISALESGPGPCRVTSLFKLLSALDLELVLQPKPDSGAGPDREAW